MSKNNNFKTPDGEFVIPSEILPASQVRFTSVADIIRQMTPINRATVAHAYMHHVREKGGAA